MSKSRTHHHHSALRRRSSPQRIMPSLIERSECANCPDLAPCPVCPQGQMCQLQVPATCQQCPTNACVAMPQEHSNKAAYTGGAIGGILGALALAAVLLWAYRKRSDRAKEALESARADAKQRSASAEKFRVGGNKGTAGGADGSKEKKSLGPAGLARRKVSKGSNDGVDDEEEELDDEEDVEWTELREDGLTTFRKPPGDRVDEEDDLEARPRRSIGAATHLSRITEGAEDDEEEERVRSALRRSAHRNTIIEESETERSYTRERSSQSSADSTSRPMGNSFGAVPQGNPFLDAAGDTQSLQSISSSSSLGCQQEVSIPSSVAERASTTMSGDSWQISGRWGANLPEAPTNVHRATGAPLVDLHGKPRSAVASQAHGQGVPISPLPSPYNIASPVRPLRDANLNLRLEDGAEPGKIGNDIKRGKRTPFSDGASNQERHTSNEAATHDTDELRELPSELAGSNVYTRHIGSKSGQSQRVSIMTTNTTSSAGTFDYVMSAPRIIASDGPKRIQVHPGGKAQLVRDLAGLRRDKDTAASAASSHDSAGAVSVVSHADPFLEGDNVTPVSGRVSPSGTFGADCARPDSDITFGHAPDGANDSRFLGHRASGLGPRASNLSGASLPFIEERPMGEPMDRSPTDANPRDSISVASAISGRGGRRADLVGLRSSSASSLVGARRSTASGIQSGNAQRQSATSIGGLSVFDDIPFHIGSPTSPASQNASSSNSRAYADAEMPADAQAKIEESKRRLEEQERQQQPEQQKQRQGEPQHQQLPPVLADVTPPFDEIRLRHELENYPFEVKNQ